MFTFLLAGDVCNDRNDETLSIGAGGVDAVGLLNGTPVVHFTFLDRQGNWFNPEFLPKTVFSYMSPQYQPAAFKQKTRARGLSIPYMEAFVAPFDDAIVFEAPALSTQGGDGNGVVAAVLQTRSSDNGKTWSAPNLTTSARICELGKSPKAQGFYGKLTKSTVPR